MRTSARELNRATLARQLLLGREPLGVADAVRRVVALQAQHPASPYLALWNRVDGFDPADLDAAFAGYAVVKASLMRMTLHAVHADDFPVFRAAVEPTLRATRLGRDLPDGLTVDAADALVRDLLSFADRPRTPDELEARCDGVPGAWRVLRMYAPLLRAPTGGPWSFGARPVYVAAAAPSLDEDDALRVLVRRYLEGFGPATVRDVAKFALVQGRRVRRVLDDDVEWLEGPEGAALLDVTGAARPAADTPAPPRLLGMWDHALLADADRSRVVPPEYRGLVIRSNGDVLPTLLVDGHVAGVWRPVQEGIEATAFHRLPASEWDALAAEADALTALLAEREPNVYRRYDRWWNGLPTAEVRVLPG